MTARSEEILLRIVEMLENSAHTEDYIVRPYMADDFSQDQAVVGVLDVDYDLNFESEPDLFRDGLSRVQQTYRIRATKWTNGGDAAARAGVAEMIDRVKAALSTTRGNLNDHPRIERHSVKFPSIRYDNVAKRGNPDAELYRRSATVAVTLVVYQDPLDRA